jgi:hypothetical protein
MGIERILAWAVRDPRKLFLIDGAGAILSIVLLGYVLVEWVEFFGIPIRALNVLVIFPCLYLAFDLYCLLSSQLRFRLCLKVIGSLNLCYFVFAIGSALYFYNELTIFGRLFVTSESALIIVLSAFEFRVARLL